EGRGDVRSKGERFGLGVLTRGLDLIAPASFAQAYKASACPFDRAPHRGLGSFFIGAARGRGRDHLKPLSYNNERRRVSWDSAATSIAALALVGSWRWRP